MSIPPAHTHTVRCPLCAAAYTTRTQSSTPPAPQPCSGCWSTLEAPLRASFLRRMRADAPAARALAHRDPVAYAPATLAAYVEHLERALEAAEARLAGVDSALRAVRAA